MILCIPFVLWFSVAFPRAQDKGEISIRCEAGVEVFLDGTSQGKTTKDGLTLKDVPAGRHKLKLVKEGHHPQETEVTVEAGKTAAVDVPPFRPMPGEIQIKTDEGVEVFIDGESKGTTRNEPLVVQRVEPGKHRVKLVRLGYVPQEFEVQVDPGKTVQPKIEPFKPDVKTSESDEEPPYSIKDKTGWLIVKSLPASCAVSCEPLGLEKVKKSKERWSAFGIPPGKYPFQFSIGNKKVEQEVEFKAGGKVFLMVYLAQNRVTVNLGEILVKCDAGFEVWVDDEPKGTTTQDAGGLLVRDIAPGRHKVKVKKFGFKPIEESCSVEVGATAECRPSTYSLKPEIFVSEDGKEPDPAVKEKMWKLVVRSLPVECTVDCYDLELKKAPKTKPKWVAYGAIDARFSLTFAAGRESVYHDVKIAPGKTMFLMVYFATRKVEVDKGEVHVQAEAGVAVKVDGTDQGKTTDADGGLIVRDLPPGKHQVTAVKPDCHPQSGEVSVEPGETAVFACKAFKPILTIVEEGEPPDPTLPQKKATLFVRSSPPECVIDCEPLGLEGAKKTKETWTAFGIPDGAFEIAFTAGGKKISHRAQFRIGRRVRLGVDFETGKAEVLPPTAADFDLVADFTAQSRFTSSGYINSTHFSPDGRWVVSNTGNKLLKVWDGAAAKEFDAFPASDEILEFSFHPDGSTVAVLGRMGLDIWDLAKRRPLRRLLLDEKEGYAHLLHLGSSLFISVNTAGGQKPEGRFLDPQTGKVQRTLALSDSVDAVAINAQGTLLATALHDYKIRLWNLSDLKEARKLLSFHRDWVHGLSFDSKGRYLASGSSDRTVRIWDVSSGRSTKTITLSDRVRSVVWSSDGTYIAAGDITGRVTFLDSATGKTLRQIRAHKGETRTLCLSPDGKTAASGGQDGHVRLYRMLE